MAVLKLPAGTTPTISANATSRAFVSYGQITQGGDVAYTVVSRRMAVLQDPDAPTAVTIITPPAQGRAVARPDGRISLDLHEVDPGAALTLVYDKTVSGQISRVTADITVTPGEKQGGWDIGAWYGLEVDPTTDALIVEPAPDTRKVHISQAGLTADDIVLREPGLFDPAEVTTSWLTATIADGQGDFYGATPALALHESLGAQLFRSLSQTEFSSPWALFRRGDSFTEGGNLDGVRGYSRLYPALIGSYGSGSMPRFTGDAFSTFGEYPFAVVAQDIDYDRSLALNNAQFAAVDNLRARNIAVPPGAPYPLTSQGINAWQRALTFRRMTILDAVPTAPNQGRALWDEANGDRTSGFYYTRVLGGLVEKCFVDMAGWAFGYRADRDGTFPKSPEDRSHAIYEQGNSSGVTKRNLILTRASHSALQNRSGGIVERVFAAGGNTGVNPANSGTISPDGTTVDYSTWSLMLDYVQTVAGHKDFYDGTKGNLGYLGVLAGGISNSSPRFSIARSIVAHGGTGMPIIGPGDIGPVGNAGDGLTSYFAYRHVDYDITNQPAEPLYEDIKVYEWNSSLTANIGVEGLDTATLDATTIGAFTDAWKGTSGAGLDDFCAALRLEDAPWDQLGPVLAFFQSGFGYDTTPRSLAQTVAFQPAPTGHTPGHRADMRDDWDTGDLPGSVAGDSIDLGGHHVHWNITPANAIADLSFGTGGRLTMLGGALRPGGTVTTGAGGNDLTLLHGAKFHMTGFAGPAPLRVRALDARFVNTGTVTGPMDIDAGFMSEVILGSDTGDFTLQPGHSLTLRGTARVGFDGTGGGAASLTLSAGSALAFKPTLRLAVTGLSEGSFSGAPKLPMIGSTVTAAGGATGRVADRISTARFDCYLILEDLAGVFTAGEAVSCDATETGVFPEGASAVGMVTGAVDYTLGQIGEISTGYRDQAAPDVASTVILGGTLSVDVTGMLSGSYRLIDVDTLTGAFDTVTATGLNARDLIVTTAAGHCDIEITPTGTGQVL